MKPQTPRAVIAVVDDDESVRLAIASLLRSCGWTVRCYASGSELLSGIDGAGITLIIADIQMPGMDGFVLIGKLAERRPDIPVIFVTAYAAADTLDKTAAAGATDFFTKPLDDVAFLGRIAEIAGTSPP